MKFLSDQDVYQLTVERLKEWGHDVVTAKELSLNRATDEELLDVSKKTNRVLVTRDKDFGALIFLKKKKSTGIILLRVTPKTVEKVHKKLKVLLLEKDERELKSSFCVIEHDRYRIRRL
jgi:predicted nuclease of predicted toxin-antitoxin system